MLSARNAKNGVSNVHSNFGLYYSPEPRPEVVWLGEAPAPASQPEADPQF
ncbi:hypothetical protein [Hymenobacter norwichensis]|nr:hypothetical protein [Hymenobacter norwichensis]